MTDEVPGTNALELATELTIAWLANPNTRATITDTSDFLRAIHQAVQDLAHPGPNQGSAQGQAENYTPAVTVRRSLSSPDHIISLIDGKAYKTLRRHLSRHDLTPEQYRERYNLKPDYPMVAPAYSEVRRTMAKTIGLGQKGRAGRSLASDGKSAKPSSESGARKRRPSKPK